GQGHELLDVDDLRGLALELLELLLLDEHVLVLGELVAPHELAALDRLVAHRAERLLLDPAPALGVEHVERHPARGGRGGDLDRDGDQPERDRSGADGVGRHDRSSNEKIRSPSRYHGRPRAPTDPAHRTACGRRPRGGPALVIDERAPALETYRKMRDPDRTPEPFGGRR